MSAALGVLEKILPLCGLAAMIVGMIAAAVVEGSIRKRPGLELWSGWLTSWGHRLAAAGLALSYDPAESPWLTAARFIAVGILLIPTLSRILPPRKPPPEIL